MAKRTQIIMIDDLEGEELREGGKTVQFGLEGVHYEIDVSEKNARRLKDALAPFIAAGRRVNARHGSTPSFPVRTDRQQLQLMREWAKNHGFKVSERGRVSREIQDAYHAAR